MAFYPLDDNFSADMIPGILEMERIDVAFSGRRNEDTPTAAKAARISIRTNIIASVGRIPAMAQVKIRAMVI